MYVCIFYFILHTLKNQDEHQANNALHYSLLPTKTKISNYYTIIINNHYTMITINLFRYKFRNQDGDNISDFLCIN